MVFSDPNRSTKVSWKIWSSKRRIWSGFYVLTQCFHVHRLLRGRPSETVNSLMWRLLLQIGIFCIRFLFSRNKCKGPYFQNSQFFSLCKHMWDTSSSGKTNPLQQCSSTKINVHFWKFRHFSGLISHRYVNKARVASIT